MPFSSSTCVVLVPFLDHIDPFCEQSLHALERQDYTVRRVQGYSAIDLGRSVLASRALDDGFDNLLWIDSDIVFQPADVEKLRGHNLPLVCGIYPKKRQKEFACEFLPGTPPLTFGKGGGLHEIRYAGFGFTWTRREVYEKIRASSELPECNQRFGAAFVPYFLPMVLGPTRQRGSHDSLAGASGSAVEENGARYLTEDYAFCERARRAGVVPMADTTIRLLHVGSHGYSWDDVAG